MEEDDRHSPSCVWLQAYGYGRVPLVEEDDEVKVELGVIWEARESLGWS